MANDRPATKAKTRFSIIAIESLAMGASAEGIAAAGGTIPQNTGEILFYCPTGDDLHWHPTGTPTSSFGHAVPANEIGQLAHNQHLAKIISDDGSDVTVLIAYMRGSGRGDSFSLARPF